VVVVEGDGRRLEERRYAHSEEGLAALVRRLLELDVYRVAIERPDGLVVDRLLEAGISVVPVHPKQLAAARDRYRAGGGKSDGFDAYVLAELARTDMHRLRLLAPYSHDAGAQGADAGPRGPGRTAGRARQAAAGAARGLLPGAARIFSAVDSPIALAFLERYPSPADAGAWARSALRPSSPATATAGASARASCSRGCAPPRRQGWAKSRRKQGARSCSSPASSPSSSRSRS